MDKKEKVLYKCYYNQHKIRKLNYSILFYCLIESINILLMKYNCSFIKFDKYYSFKLECSILNLP